MSEPKHTPGPWFVSGVRVKWQEPGWPEPADAHAIKGGPNEDIIALVLYDPRQHALCWADARVISAASALLEAAQAIIAECGPGYTLSPSCGVLDRLQAAVAKAEGRP